MQNNLVLQQFINEAYIQTNINFVEEAKTEWVWQRAKMHTQSPVGYIRINKNASQFFDKHLSDDWKIIHVKLDNLSPYKDYNYFATLRDPIERWISGITTYLTLHQSSPNFGIQLFDGEFPEAFETLRRSKFFKNLFQDYLIEITGEDLHTCSQLWFISFFNLKKINFFYLNDRLGYQINKFLNVYNIKNTCNNYKINQTPQSELYSFINEMIRDESNVNFKNKLKNIYKYDYQFLENINFYAR
jgi:hypothetical protein